MRASRQGVLLFGASLAALIAAVQETPKAVDAGASSEPITVALAPSTATRPGRITGVADAAKIAFSGPPIDHLARRGVVRVDGCDYALHLPKADHYLLENRGKSDSELDNTSTLLSIDGNGDGVLTGDEGWYANLPVRIGDRMFDVVAIADDGSSVTLRRSSSPLHGMVVGRKVPTFEFATADGVVVSDRTLAGKPFVLDVWSVT